MVPLYGLVEPWKHAFEFGEWPFTFMGIRSIPPSNLTTTKAVSLLFPIIF